MGRIVLRLSEALYNAAWAHLRPEASTSRKPGFSMGPPTTWAKELNSRPSNGVESSLTNLPPATNISSISTTTFEQA